MKPDRGHAPARRLRARAQGPDVPELLIRRGAEPRISLSSSAPLCSSESESESEPEFNAKAERRSKFSSSFFLILHVFALNSDLLFFAPLRLCAFALKSDLPSPSAFQHKPQNERATGLRPWLSRSTLGDQGRRAVSYFLAVFSALGAALASAFFAALETLL